MLYRTIVGEGGCDADYFMRVMSVAEAEDFAAGMAVRRRDGWEQTRVLCQLVHKVLTGKDIEMRFAWDKKVDATMNEDELAALRARAKEMEQLMNKNRRK